MPSTVWALSQDKYAHTSHTHTELWPWVLYTTHGKCCVSDTGTHHSQPSQHIASVSWFTRPSSVCLCWAHKQMHVGSYNFLASKTGNKRIPPKKRILKRTPVKCVHVFIAYTPTKLVIMYMYDVCREAQRGKKKKEKEKRKRWVVALKCTKMARIFPWQQKGATGGPVTWAKQGETDAC